MEFQAFEVGPYTGVLNSRDTLFQPPAQRFFPMLDRLLAPLPSPGYLTLYPQWVDPRCLAQEPAYNGCSINLHCKALPPPPQESQMPQDTHHHGSQSRNNSPEGPFLVQSLPLGQICPASPPGQTEANPHVPHPHSSAKGPSTIIFPYFTTGKIVLTLTSRLNCCRPPCSPSFMEKRAPSPAPLLRGRARSGAASAALALADCVDLDQPFNHPKRHLPVGRMGFLPPSSR